MATEGGNNNEKLSTPLFSGWRLTTVLSLSSLSLKVLVNLARVQTRLIDPVDAAFEAECIAEWVGGLETLLVASLTRIHSPN